MIHHRHFEKTIMGCIVANILVMAMQHRLTASLTRSVQLSKDLRGQCPDLPLRTSACLSCVVWHYSRVVVGCLGVA